MNNKTSVRVRTLCLCGLMGAIIAVATAFIKIPTGINNNYIHIGDAIVYITACLIPTPWGALAAAIGGGLADLLAGFPQWAIITAIIKPINTLPLIIATRIYRKKHNTIRIITPATVAMSVLSGVWTVGAYFVAEWLMYSFPAALPSIPFNAIQAVASTILYIVIGAALDAIKINKYIG